MDKDQRIAGTVTQFDEHIGLGEITTDSGDVVPFHCVNIANGSRTIEIGAKVNAETFLHARGRIEARNIT
jgi:cold shock CspA family protein